MVAFVLDGFRYFVHCQSVGRVCERTRIVVCSTLLLLLTVTQVTPSPALAASQTQSRPDFRSGTASVLVDVVVKDKRGTPVLDLTAQDFELREDDVPQRIDTVGRIISASGSSPTGVVALAFDPLSAEGQRLSSRAVMEYLDHTQAADFTGVFRLGSRPDLVQWFTLDKDAVRRAVAGLQGSGDARVARGPGPAAADVTRVTRGDPGFMWAICCWYYVDGQLVSAPKETEPPPSGGGGDSSGGGGVAHFVEDPAVRLRRFNDELLQQYPTAPLNGLAALVDSMSALPGRKTIIYFSEGLSGNPLALRQRAAVIDAANRNNVAIYTADAAGLRTNSGREEARNFVTDQGEYIVGFERPENRAWTSDLERNEDVLHSNPTKSLAALAEQTGGFGIAETNSLAPGLRVIEADRQSYYLLRYTPANIHFKGEFRRISVRVSRPGLVVRARSGYRAVPSSVRTKVMLGDEPAALAALTASPRPTDLTVRGKAASVPRRGATGRVVVVVRASAAQLAYETEAGRFHADSTLVGVLRSATGEAVQVVSRRFDLAGASKDIDATQAKTLELQREIDVPEGAYTLEYVAYDALAKRAGTGEVPVAIPGAGPGPAVGSLLVVRGAEPAPRLPEGQHDPFAWNGVRLEPNLGEPLAQATRTISFILPIAVDQTDGVTATLALSHDGQALGSTPIDIPPADADGRRVIAQSLPASDLAPGEYTLKIVVRAGAATDAREVRFTIGQ